VPQHRYNAPITPQRSLRVKVTAIEAKPARIYLLRLDIEAVVPILNPNVVPASAHE
jgi:hypothetical protein